MPDAFVAAPGLGESRRKFEDHRPPLRSAVETLLTYPEEEVLFLAQLSGKRWWLMRHDRRQNTPQTAQLYEGGMRRRALA
jgi:hypothetical protein